MKLMCKDIFENFKHLFKGVFQAEKNSFMEPKSFKPGARAVVSQQLVCDGQALKQVRECL